MEYLTKSKFLIFLLMLWVISCGSPNQTSVVILSCEDTDGNEIQDDITITIDGQSKSCIPGDPLTFDVEMNVDQGYISIIASNRNYRMLSPTTYEVERSKGIELVLMFQSSDVMADAQVADESEDELAEPDHDETVQRFTEREQPEEESEPQNLNVQFDVLPRQSIVSVRSRSGNFETDFSGSGSVELLEDTYEWQAEMDGYFSSSGSFTVSAESDNIVTIQLEVEEPEPGTLSMVINPRNASVNLQNRSTGQNYSFDSAGARDIELPPGLYDYQVSASGYIPEESNFRIREAGSSELFVSLSSAGASELISQAENVITNNQAQQIFNVIQQSGIPRSDSETRHRLFSSLSEVAMILYHEGAQLNARELFSILHQENPSDVRVRHQYGTILIRSGEYQEGREMLRPVFGRLLNTIPRSDREAIEFRSRFRHAESFYLQFRSLPEDDYDSRQSIGARAISELADVVFRFERAADRLEEFQHKAVQAEDWEFAVRRELGL